MTDGSLPINERTEEIGCVDGESLPRLRSLRTLQELALTHQLFTPALLFAYGLLDREIVLDWARAHNLTGEDVPTIVDCSEPIFQQLPRTIAAWQPEPVDWNHRIMAVKHELWESLRGSIGNVSLVFRPGRFYAKIGWYDLLVVDPLHLKYGGRVAAVDAQPQQLPVVSICVFMLESNRGRFYIQPATDPPRTRSMPVRTNPSPETLAQAEIILSPVLPTRQGG